MFGTLRIARSKIEGVIKATGKVIEIVYDFWEKNWEMTNITVQASMAVNNVSNYLNKAISKNMIPTEFLNENDLNSLGNYIFYGEIPTMVSPSGKTITNDKLLNVGKNIWNFIVKERKSLEKDIQIPAQDNTHLPPPQIIRN